MTLPGALSKDDSEVSYYRSQKQKSTSKGGRRKVLSGRRGSQASVSSSMGAEYPTRAHSESRHRSSNFCIYAIMLLMFIFDSEIVIRNPPNRRVKSPTTAKRSTLPQVIIR
uniref:Uncharacterized protein n=1 Tax=Plectus sambesii TaxID=2011161 RepID=A0A914W0D6_9BILA